MKAYVWSRRCRQTKAVKKALGKLKPGSAASVAGRGAGPFDYIAVLQGHALTTSVQRSGRHRVDRGGHAHDHLSRGVDRMRGRARLLVGFVLGVVTVVGPAARAQGPQQAPAPQYLPFSEFAADDSAAQRSARQAYNDSVERYNKALYDYHLTLAQLNQLADVHNNPTTAPAERDKARAEAAPLRTKLETLRRDVTTLVATVDEARRKASQAGVTLIR
jgi:hypothetical protein